VQRNLNGIVEKKKKHVQFSGKRTKKTAEMVIKGILKLNLR